MDDGISEARSNAAVRSVTSPSGHNVRDPVVSTMRVARAVSEGRGAGTASPGVPVSECASFPRPTLGFLGEALVAPQHLFSLRPGERGERKGSRRLLCPLGVGKELPPARSEETAYTISSL